MPGSRPSISTPQFRTLLLRKLANLFPDLVVRIEAAPRGIVFQLFDLDGAARTNRVSLYRHTSDALTATGLKSKIVNAGRPARGFPSSLDAAG